MPPSFAFEHTVGIAITILLVGLLFTGVSETIRFFSAKPVSRERVLYAFAAGCFLASLLELALTRHWIPGT